MDIYKQYVRANYKYWMALSFCLVLLTMIISYESGWRDVVRDILMSVSTGLFASFLILFVSEREIFPVARDELSSLISKHIPNFLDIQGSGLEKISYDNNTAHLGIDIVGSDVLYLVMSDGKNFYNNNAAAIADRFKKVNRKTVLILLSENSECEKILNKRHGKSGDGYYAGKIKESIRDYCKAHKSAPATNEFVVYQHEYYFTMSVVATDVYAYIGLYRNSASKDIKPPNFLFRSSGENGEYSRIIKDIENLIEVSKKVDKGSFLSG